jgi:hypothetical protein
MTLLPTDLTELVAELSRPSELVAEEQVGSVAPDAEEAPAEPAAW